MRERIAQAPFLPNEPTGFLEQAVSLETIDVMPLRGQVIFSGGAYSAERRKERNPLTELPLGNLTYKMLLAVTDKSLYIDDIKQEVEGFKLGDKKSAIDTYRERIATLVRTGYIGIDRSVTDRPDDFYQLLPFGREVVVAESTMLSNLVNLANDKKLGIEKDPQQEEKIPELSKTEYAYLVSLGLGRMHGYEIGRATYDNTKMTNVLYSSLATSLKHMVEISLLETLPSASADKRKGRMYQVTEKGRQAVYQETKKIEKLLEIAIAKNILPKPQKKDK